ncbi:MAG: hypothetical protein U0271_10650 [Polyangiaceae bacterium]
MAGRTAPAESFGCEECGATLHFRGSRTARCPYCASPHVLVRPAASTELEPEFVVPFTVTDPRARDLARRWTESRGPFARAAIRGAPLEALTGLYLPVWLYTAVARATYAAEIGENYQEEETYTVKENGRTSLEKRTVTRTEWRRLAGPWAGVVRDVLVSASRGLAPAELSGIEPFDLRALRRCRAEPRRRLAHRGARDRRGGGDPRSAELRGRRRRQARSSHDAR